MSIISSLEDQRKLRQSGRILASLQHHLRQFIEPGLAASEIEQFALNFASKYDSKLATLGYQGYRFGTCVSINEEVVHGLPLATKILPENGLVTLDVMLNYQGLISDCARTWVLGQPGAEAIRLVEQTRQAMWSAIQKVKPGARVGDLEAAMQGIAQAERLGNVTALGGHGVGYEIHDEPMILSAGKAGKGSKIFENMVFTIEPMFTLGTSQVKFDRSKEDGWTVKSADGSLAAHEEHTILVTKKGYEVITEIAESEVLPA
jgi:methionyl aminopeptidase